MIAYFFTPGEFNTKTPYKDVHDLYLEGSRTVNQPFSSPLKCKNSIEITLNYYEVQVIFGSLIVNLVKSPGSLSRIMSPPWATTIS
jgi:hypothetical protein